jgi:hypothetical protein
VVWEGRSREVPPYPDLWPDPAAPYGSAYWGAPAAHTRAVEVVGAAESAE